MRYKSNENNLNTIAGTNARKVHVLVILLLAFVCLSSACGINPTRVRMPEDDVFTNEPTDEISTTEPTATPLPTINPDGRIKATYLGIDNAGHMSKNAVLGGKLALYMFDVDGETRYFTISNHPETDKPGVIGYAERAYNEGGYYGVQQILAIGADYYLETVGSTIISAEKLPTGIEYTPVVQNTAGLRTLGNFLKTAMTPMGTTLYIYGGGWSFDDEGSADALTKIGVSDEWVRFFQSTDNTYSYITGREGIYPNNSWNYYNYAGLDCSGYVSFVLYNTFWNDEGHRSLLTSSTHIAADLEFYGFGDYWRINMTQDSAGYAKFIRALHPGDIVSIKGHVYIVVGTCSDDSMVIAHSAVTRSVTNSNGGGVQLSAISAYDDPNCEAKKLVDKYMNQYFPEWTARFPAVLKYAGDYMNFTKATEYTGAFSWNILAGATNTSGSTTAQISSSANKQFMTDGVSNPTGLGDPDGVRSMTAREVLAYLFGE